MVLSENADKQPDSEMGDTKEQAASNGEESHDKNMTVSRVNGGTENDQKETTSTEEKNAQSAPEVVLVQDTSFTVHIQAPGVEPFELPVSSMELVQEIHQVLYDKEETCHRTCFTLQLDGTVLDNYAELKSIEGLKDGSVIKVVDEPYTVREARLHVRHVRDLLKSIDPTDSYNGSECMSLSFLNSVTMGDLLDKKRTKPEAVDCVPPDYILPGSKDRPLLPLHPFFKDQRAPQCLKVLTYSGWNPPPGNRKMHGDLLYLSVTTLEEKKFHVTSSTRGFFVNQSTDEVFNYKAAQPKLMCHSLIDLLNHISPAFKRNFSILLKKRAQKHPFERVPTPYQVYSWLAPQQDHQSDLIRAEDSFSAKLANEEHIPGQTREWNEEIQTTRELPRTNLPERLIRERAIFKIHGDFVAAATRAAVAVIDGSIMAINPGESAKMQMFIWNNIFFSLGFDVKDHYKDFGGDNAAYAAPATDLQGVKAYTSVDAEGIYTLGTVVVDYRGYRVTAQSIIPGILEREQEQSVVYGSIDFGKTVVTNEKYTELLKKTATQLKIRPHKVLNEKGEEIELLSSVECKGIIGNDKRHYVLDLLRTFPPDVNFLPMENEELSEAVKSEGFPVAHRHRLVSLRQELVEAFVETRYMAFIKSAAWQFQQMRMKNEVEKRKELKEKTPDIVTEGVEVEEAKKLVEEIMGTDSQTFEESSKDIVRAAAKAVGSMTENAFDLTFNPDVFQPHVKHADQDQESHEKDKQLVKDAAEFLLLGQIPVLVKECLEHQVAPIDGLTLTETLHQRGINLRYLGKFTKMVEKHEKLAYLHSIAIGELVTRTAKHIFNTYLQGVETISLATALSHFLNCFLGSCPTLHVQGAPDESRSKKKNKKKNAKLRWLTSPDNTEWASETPRMLWKKILEETSTYFLYDLDVDSVDTLVEKYNIQKACLLRSFCQKIGLQIMLRDYNMDNKHRPVFSEDDIINMFPIVKHIHPKASDAYHFFTSGQTKIQQGFLRDGHELISEALNLLNNVYGPIHPEIAACNKLLARLNYIMGEHQEALAYQQRAVLISERVLGIDHPSTITEYAHLALYCFANNQISSALRLLYRARYLALLCSGENHPEVALIDSNIGLILHAVGAYDISLKFLEKALQMNTLFFGADSLKVAMGHHLVARAQSCRGDFRTALNSEKEAYNIYKVLLGESHERTKESSECLKHLTKQAVVLQKKMNEIYKGEKTVGLPPLQIQTPSLVNVLETLNLINGIVFLHLSPEDLETLRGEVATATGESKTDEDTQKNGDGDKLSDSSLSDSSPSDDSTESLKTKVEMTAKGDAPAINGNHSEEMEVDIAR